MWAAVGAVAASAGPVLGGLLITFSWRWIFLINIPLVAATVLIGLRSLPSDGERHTRHLDVLGAILVFAATGLVCTALVQISAWPARRIGGAFSLAVLLIVVFVIHVRRHPDPIIAPRLFTAHRFRAGALGILTYYVGFAVILLSSTLLLTEIWHYTALRTALAMPRPDRRQRPGSVLGAHRRSGRIPHNHPDRIGSFALAGAWPLVALGATSSIDRGSAESAVVGHGQRPHPARPVRHRISGTNSRPFIRLRGTRDGTPTRLSIRRSPPRRRPRRPHHTQLGRSAPRMGAGHRQRWNNPAHWAPELLPRTARAQKPRFALPAVSEWIPRHRVKPLNMPWSSRIWS